jgi:hypothetical protein
MQKWEYLFVRSINGTTWKFNGIEKPDLFHKILHEVFSQLGEEGWELIYQENDNDWAFKRPKS